VKVSVAWLREYVDLPELSAEDLERALVKVGLEVEAISDLGSTVEGPLVVGRVESFEIVPKVKKPIRYCRVDVGSSYGGVRGIICGAQNFAPGDLVVVALPGTVLPGGFAIAARKTYGHISDGMICSGRELGVSDEHAGIIVLDPGIAAPGDEARPLVGLDEILVELAITPDRGYCFSARGIARELSHSLGLPFRDPALSVEATPGTPEPAYPVAVVDPSGCDRFAARAVRGIDPAAQAPEWMRKRLAVAGIRSIGLAVDITNYLMVELGQPMHAFDLNLITGPLVVRRANAGDRLTTLDGVQRTLDAEDMVICDDSGPISLAAVMGGETSEVQPSTVDILFEAAHWDPVMVARTARRHKLPSEASKRWERGVDRELCLVAIEKAVRLLVQHGGGTPGVEVLDFDTRPTRRQVQLDAGLPSRVAGVEHSHERVVALLQEIGADVSADGDRLTDSTVRDSGARKLRSSLLTVTPPTWRPDLTDPADLVEEVIRLDGYDRVPSVLPIAPPGNGRTATQRRRISVGRALAEAGFVEVLTYPFVGESTLDALGIPAEDPRRQQVRLANPISEEEPALRTTLLPTLLGALRRNLGRGHRDVALYEIGLTFHPGSGGTPPVLGVDRRPTEDELAAAQAVVPYQPWHVAAVLAGDVEPAGWWGAGRPASWADAVDAARRVVETAGARVVVRAGTNPPWHPGRCAEIVVDGRVVGHAGELHPAVCAALDLPGRTAAMELVLDDVALPGVVTTPAVSSYPPALIDVALVVDAATPAAEVQRALTDGAGELLEGVRLFDVYTGAQVGDGRKSLAYKLTFRAADRTLTVEEAVAARDAAVGVAAQRLGAALRGA
jgi:phenylalanyl-tRNA synthetase beta chain